MKFGNHPAGGDGDDGDVLSPQPDDWARIYHRDLVSVTKLCNTYQSMT